jgi:phage anti-repressor protein
MASEIVRQDVQSLVDGWLKAEQEGTQFPVDFDIAWSIAGYTRKDNAKRKLVSTASGLVKDEDFAFLISEEWSQEGRSSDLIVMTCDAFKQFCLMAKTDQGKAIRLYFIDAEKKWKLVQQHAPAIAQEIELMHLKIELAKQEAIKATAEEKVLSIRQYVATALPESVQQKILGFSEIKTIEYRDRILHDDDVVRDGSTINKTEICRRLNLATRSGAPDYKKLNKVLCQMKLPDDAWRSVASIRENEELCSEYWGEIERKYLSSDRNLYLGE